MPVAITRTLTATTAALLLACSPVAPAHAEEAVAASGGSIVVTGHGWGHGRGMSQYGAYGAARKGLTAQAILAFYYPGTSLGSVPDTTLRVWISGDTDGKLHLCPDAGLVVSDSAGTSVVLPRGRDFTKWRISRSGAKRVLAYRNAAGRYVRYQSPLDPSRVWSVDNPSTSTVRLAMPDGSTRTYPGGLGLSFSGTRAITVNNVSLETYLRTVVPAEMPASWGSAANHGFEALRAQSVAARSYAVRTRAAKAPGSPYDICDSSSCQVYRPIGSRTALSDAAIAATAGTVVLYAGRPVLTEFSSSNGGWTAETTGVPHFPAQQDPYDASSPNPSATWTKSLTAARLQAAYPAIGRFSSIQVSRRSGSGPDGGRVTAIIVTGDRGSVGVTGTSFKKTFSLKETLFTLGPAPSVNPASAKRH